MKKTKNKFLIIILIFFSIGLFFLDFNSSQFIILKPTIKAELSTNSINNTVVNTYNLKVLTIRIDPILKTQGYIYASQYMEEHDVYGLYRDYESVKNEYKNNINASSHGVVSVTVVKEEILNEFPTYVTSKTVKLKNNTYANRFDEETWLDAMQQGIYSFIQSGYNITFGDFDYEYLINKFNLVERKNNGEFDMVWLVDLNDSGICESCIVGKNAYWDNGNAIIKDCNNFQIMALTLPRSETYLECYGHAAEYTLQKVFYDNSDIMPPTVTSQEEFDNLSTWYKFLQAEYVNKNGTPVSLSPGYAVAGNVHYAPNSTEDYDWNNNNTYVYSTAQDWIDNYPNLSSFTKAKKLVNANQWNKYNSFNINLSHKIWWFSVMPHVQGRDKDGFSNNWWDYIVSLDSANSIENTQSYYNYEINDVIKNITFNVNYKSGTKGIYTIDKLSANTTVVSGEDNLDILSDGTVKAKNSGQVILKTFFDGCYTTTTINILPQTYTVTWKDGNNNVLASNEVQAGEIPQYSGSTPTKNADLVYTYFWAGNWDKQITACDADTIYTAVFEKVYIEYTITFQNYDGSIISSSKYHYGDTVIPPDNYLEREGYIFNGWNKTIRKVDSDETYIASYRTASEEHNIIVGTIVISASFALIILLVVIIRSRLRK